MDMSELLENAEAFSFLFNKVSLRWLWNFSEMRKEDIFWLKKSVQWKSNTKSIIETKGCFVPVSMDWDNPERTVIRVTFDGQWDTDDLYRMINKGNSMIESVNHIVDSIFDFTHSSSSPTSALSTLGRMESSHSEKERLIIIVKASSYIKTLCNIARKLAPKTFANILFVDSINEAYTAISKQVTAVSVWSTRQTTRDKRSKQ